MHLDHLTIILSLFSLTHAKPVPAAKVTSTSTTKTTTTPTTICSYTTSTSPPTTLTCGTAGTLSSTLISSLSAQLSSTSSSTLLSCQSLCQANSNCTSFGFDATAKLCVLYSKPIAQLVFLASPVAGPAYYDAGCFVQKCETVSVKSSSKTTTTTTSAAKITTTSAVKTTTTSAAKTTKSTSTLPLTGSTTSMSVIEQDPISSSASGSGNSTSATITSPAISSSTSSSATLSVTPSTNTTSTTTPTSTPTPSAACSPPPSTFNIAILNTTSSDPPTYLTPLSSSSPLQPLTTTPLLSQAGLFTLLPSPLDPTQTLLSFTLPDGTSRILYSEQDAYPYGGGEDIYFEQGYAMQRYGDAGVTWTVVEGGKAGGVVRKKKGVVKSVVEQGYCALQVGVQGAAGEGYVVMVCETGMYAGGVEVGLWTVEGAANVDPGLGCQVVELVVVAAE